MRFISTCVEQTPLRARSPAFFTVHLHVRGADFVAVAHFVFVIGSSPRAWSRLATIPRRDDHVRFISTCVEQTRPLRYPLFITPVHLHVRGADWTTYAWNAGHGGSSPRAWSRLDSFAKGMAETRFISTCVEQTRRRPAHPTARPVHLHVRGADTFSATGAKSNAGSSPRAWSRRDDIQPRAHGARFISTCVEQTASGSC